VVCRGPTAAQAFIETDQVGSDVRLAGRELVLRRQQRLLRVQDGLEAHETRAVLVARQFECALAGFHRFCERPLPDLLVMDGGPAQLQVALEVLESFSLDFIPSIGLAELSETIYIPGEETPIQLPRNSAPQHLIERLRDEAHRFAISYHRNIHNRNALYSVLDSIPGVGDKRKRALFDAFLTIEAIKAASIEELNAVAMIDARTAESVFQYFHREDHPNAESPPAD